MKIKTIRIKFEIGQSVFAKTDPDQNERQITGLLLREGIVVYKVTFNTIEDSFYGFELSEEKNILKSLS